MDIDDFVHLHAHTRYSDLDGAADIGHPKHPGPIVDKLKTLGMNAYAITDHGEMYGVFNFYHTLKKAGIKPIIGVEAYVARNSRLEKQGRDQNHLVLLAQNEVGYQNLCILTSEAHREQSFYYKPRIDRELLSQHSEGIIALSACLGGEILTRLIKGIETGESTWLDEAEAVIRDYRDILPGRFYLELQNQGLQDTRNGDQPRWTQVQLNDELARLASKYGIPLIATNDVHYVEKEDSEAHDAIVAIGTKKTLNEFRQQGKLLLPPEFYLKSGEDMKALFPQYPEAVANTRIIADQCNVNLDQFYNTQRLPVFQIPATFKPQKTKKEREDAYFEKLVRDGFNHRYPVGHLYRDEALEAMNYQVSMIQHMGFSSYFLIVQDFCNYAKDNGIAVGPGRGSAAASVVSYILRITDIDPLRYDLIFERFLNPERVSMPDIDIDFEPEGREQVYNYVRDKYGADYVSQIITFGTIGAKFAIRDVGRVLEIPLDEVDRVAKMVSDEPGISLKDAIEMSPELEATYHSSPETEEWIGLALKVEGTIRQTSTHAAGVVITDEPLDHILPLARASEGGMCTAFYKTEVEEAGLLKMDFLGLRNLSIIKDCITMLKKKGIDYTTQGIIEYLESHDDAKTYELLQSGNTEAVFQLESSGMQGVCKELKPTCIEDIIAILALYRPGPMDQIPEFIARKHGKKPIEYLHPLMENSLKVTYGIIVYQEQVQQLARDLAGYSLGQADLLRRAMGKKIKEAMDEERGKFIYGLEETDDQGNETGKMLIPGCISKGIPEDVAQAIFDLMAKFAEYGFNKGHAAAYGIITMITAYLKANHPVEYMASTLTSVTKNQEKISVFLNSCKKMGISILSPDVNISDVTFTPDGNVIRYGLGAIRQLGASSEKIIQGRDQSGEFTSLNQFLEEVNINSGAIRSLILAGALDNVTSYSRKTLFENLENITMTGSVLRGFKLEGKPTLFDLPGFESFKTPPIEDDGEEFSTETILQYEKDVLGRFISAHPLDEWKAFSPSLCEFLETDEEEGYIDDIFYITELKRIITGKGDPMAIASLEDFAGEIKAVCFPRSYIEAEKQLVEGTVLTIKGKFSKDRDGSRQIIIDKVSVPEKKKEKVLLAPRMMVSSEDEELLLSWVNVHLKISKGQKKGKMIEVSWFSPSTRKVNILGEVERIPQPLQSLIRKRAIISI